MLVTAVTKVSDSKTFFTPILLASTQRRLAVPSLTAQER